MINIDPHGNVVLPCYVHNDYVSSTSLFESGIEGAVADFDWKKIENCQRSNLNCYAEPSFTFSGDVWTFLNWCSIS